MKKMANAMLYCSPFIPRLGSSPSILAFPGTLRIGISRFLEDTHQYSSCRYTPPSTRAPAWVQAATVYNLAGILVVQYHRSYIDLDISKSELSKGVME